MLYFEGMACSALRFSQMEILLLLGLRWAGAYVVRKGCSAAAPKTAAASTNHGNTRRDIKIWLWFIGVVAVFGLLDWAVSSSD